MCKTYIALSYELIVGSKWLKFQKFLLLFITNEVETVSERVTQRTKASQVPHIVRSYVICVLPSSPPQSPMTQELLLLVLFRQCINQGPERES